MILGSFKNPAEAQLFNIALPTKWYFRNFSYVIKEGGIGRASINSFSITIFVTIVVLTVFTLTGFIKNVPRELDEAAFIDGATPLKMFFKIILPLLKPILATALVTTAMYAWNEFMVPRQLDSIYCVLIQDI